MIQITNLHKSYKKNYVLKGIELAVEEGKITAILGPNGSGKTTLIKSILGMVIPQIGDIHMNGNSILKKWQYRSELGYLPQIAKFPDNLKVKELVKMISDVRNQNGNSVGLIKLFDLDIYMNYPLRNLSGGTKQKINIMLTFMFDSPFYILDEPTSGLDPVSLINFRELLRSERDKGKTILLTTHILNLVEEVADNIIFLLEGKIFFKGSLDSLKDLQDDEKLEYTIAGIYKGANE